MEPADFLGNVAIGLLVQWITASRSAGSGRWHGTGSATHRPGNGRLFSAWPGAGGPLAQYPAPPNSPCPAWRPSNTGDAAAITLIDVVLFRSDWDGRHDLKLWAHEMTHVEQYRRWGVDGFAGRYVADSGAVEREAYANADRFEAWRSSAATQRPHR